MWEALSQAAEQIGQTASAGRMMFFLRRAARD
jgi:hypothetical protein